MPLKMKSKEDKNVRWKGHFLKGTAGIARIMTMGLILNGITPSGTHAAGGAGINFADVMDEVELEAGEEDLHLDHSSSANQQRFDETQTQDETTS